MVPSPATRRGLSTLEMVLALPILLMIMALMVNFGTVAAWKVRALTVSRNSVFSARWPRSGNTDPRPPYWPQNANCTHRVSGQAPPLDHPGVNHPVARGPLPFGAQVNADLLDPNRGLVFSSVALTRGFPMLGKMGKYHLEAHTYILDDKWQYQRMGLRSTRARRIPVIYSLQKAPESLVNAYISAVVAVMTAPFQPELQPLDNDDEFIGYGIMFGFGSSAPDFHPRLQRFCDLDRSIADDRAENLTDRIRGRYERNRHVSSVAETMARAFIGLYNRVIRAIQKQNPPMPGAQGMIAALQQKIDTLDQFLSNLQAAQQQQP